MKESKSLRIGIWVFTIVVYALVISLHYIPKPNTVPAFTQYLPVLHAVLNGTCFVLLVASLIAIKKKNVRLHKTLNTIAMALSVVFLLSYVLYHVTNDDTKYEGPYAVMYYSVLFSHILLAGLSLPGILFAFYRGLIGDIEKHRKIVRITYPVWLYVTLTGVLVYLFLKPYYLM